MINKVGILGRGFVGGSLEKFFKENCEDLDVTSYDVCDDIDINQGYEKLVDNSQLIFVCLPTPMDKLGECYIEIVKKACIMLDSMVTKKNKKIVLVIKSTMAPMSTYNIQAQVSSQVYINPEFLTERTAYQDVCNTDKHLLGCAAYDRVIPTHDVELEDDIVEFFEKCWPESKAIVCSSVEAEMIKYLTNSFFAYKVFFANHVFNLCSNLNVDYDQFINNATYIDPRLGDEHWKVPGPDGNFGFGGKCLPKDFKGFIELSRKLGVNQDSVDILDSVWNANKVLRKKDWEGIDGTTLK